MNPTFLSRSSVISKGGARQNRLRRGTMEVACSSTTLLLLTMGCSYTNFFLPTIKWVLFCTFANPHIYHPGKFLILTFRLKLKRRIFHVISMIQKQWQAKQRPDKMISANVVNNGANENLVVVHVKIKYEETLTLLSCAKLINAHLRSSRFQCVP